MKSNILSVLELIVSLMKNTDYVPQLVRKVSDLIKQTIDEKRDDFTDEEVAEIAKEAGSVHDQLGELLSQKKSD